MSDPVTNSGPVLVGKMKITDGERAKRKALDRAPRPRLASTLVLTCGAGENLKILMGQRSKRHDFMPSVYVFPGGRVDRADSYAKYAGDLSPRTERIFHASYDAFRAAGQLPDLSGIEVFGRAVTPPHRHKRFDAWFFVKDLGDREPPKIADSSELLNVGWFTFAQIEQLETQRATDMMLQVLKRYLKADRPPERIFYSRAVRGEFKMLQFP